MTSVTALLALGAILQLLKLVSAILDGKVRRSYWIRSFPLRAFAFAFTLLAEGNEGYCAGLHIF